MRDCKRFVFALFSVILLSLVLCNAVYADYWRWPEMPCPDCWGTGFLGNGNIPCGACNGYKSRRKEFREFNQRDILYFKSIGAWTERKNNSVILHLPCSACGARNQFETVIDTNNPLVGYLEFNMWICSKCGYRGMGY
ncbi:hypothetical protein IJT93_06045 [bacterium]|nr:hypothetical protein [bacterium]